MQRDAADRRKRSVLEGHSLLYSYTQAGRNPCDFSVHCVACASARHPVPWTEIRDPFSDLEYNPCGRIAQRAWLIEP
jgi:hypothetical protein